MKPYREIAIYICAWLIYVFFSVSVFNELKITVMQFSIPLTMLGGWIYSYKGAFFTILLTTPYHYFMLKFNSDAHSIHMEAFNPFGLSSLFLFSFGTAYLKRLQVKYKLLNNSLEEIVNERTADLTRLTNYLITTREFNFDLGARNLLVDPLNKLTSMQKSCNTLSSKLRKEDNTGLTLAKHIDELIVSSIRSLSDLGAGLIAEPSYQLGTNETDVRSTIKALTLTDTDAAIKIEGSWEELPKEQLNHIIPIIQEAVNNALRHASPKIIKIEVVISSSTYLLSIENDGEPFSKSSAEGMGMSLMRYHSELLSATLLQDITASGNTQITCSIPKP